MEDLTLDDLFTFGNQTDVREFFLPIDETVPGFDKDWLKHIVTAKGKSDEEKLAAVKSHQYIRTGHIVQADLDKLGLQMLFYKDDKGDALTSFQELAFYHGPATRPTIERLNQLTKFTIGDLNQVFLYLSQKGYGYQDIDPRLAEITQIGNFAIDYFGPADNCSKKNQIRATKKFEYDGGKALLIYFMSLDKEGNVDDFSISFEAFSQDGQPSDVMAKIDVKRRQGRYVPEAEIRVKSKSAQMLGSHYGLVSYNFGPDGRFDSIRLHGPSLTFERQSIEAMERVYAGLEGVVWTDGQYCLMLTEQHEKKDIAALMTADGCDHHAIQALKEGKVEIGKDYRLVPVIGLLSAPGLQSDLLSMQYYRTFVGEFGNLALFKNAKAESVGIDYVDAIRMLASLQHKPAHEVPLLT